MKIFMSGFMILVCQRRGNSLKPTCTGVALVEFNIVNDYK